MKRLVRTRALALLVGAAFVALMSHASVARAQVHYQLDVGAFTERFNNSELDETEDNWVANSYQVVDGGTTIISVDFPIGNAYSNKPATAAIYQGFDLFDPNAGGGLVRVATQDFVINSNPGDLITVTFDNPATFNVGDILYAAVLIPQVQFPGGSEFPWFNDGTLLLNRSFFDVGQFQGGPYDLDNTVNATVNGGVHPVVDSGVQSPGTTLIRATGTP